MKDITKPLTSKILQHLKRVELHYLGNMRAGNRCSTDFPNKKLFRMLSPREKKQYEMWAKKGFWMQHAAVQECNQQSLSKNLVWITRTDSFIRALRRWPCSLIKVGELTTALKSLYEHAQKPERPVTPPKEPKAPHAPRARRYRPLSVGKLDQRFRSLLAMSLGVDLDE